MDLSWFNLWYQALFLAAILIVIIGYFQYRKRNGDIIEVAQEMARPSYIIMISLVVLVFIVLRVVSDFIGRVL